MRQSLISKTVAGLAFLSCSLAAQAATLEIQFGGLDLNYTGTTISDAKSSSGGSGNPAQADPIDTATFLVDGSNVGTLSSDIYLDVSITDVSNIPTGGGSVNSGSGYFDLLTKSSNPGWGLEVDFTTVQVNYIAIPETTELPKFEIAIIGAAAGSAGQQDLPFGLEMGDLVTFTFSSTNFTTTDGGTPFLTGFDASATGNITGPLVPVPAAIWLFGSGLLGLVGIARRKAV